MKKDVFITRVSKFFPNNKIENDQMEDYLGKIGGNASRVKSIILRQNGIKNRYYALNTNQGITHSNAGMTASSILGLFDKDITLGEIELLSCGTSTPDQLMPSHTAMVQGVLKCHPMEIISPSGVCASGAHAIKVAYMSIVSGNTSNAVCTGSESTSSVMLSKNYDEEYEKLALEENKPMIAFEKDFLRFMLSDGAGAMLLEDKKRGDMSLKIEWIESISYANDIDSCMYMGAEKNEKGELVSWKNFTEKEWLEKSIFVIKQDVRLLNDNIVVYAMKHLNHCFSKHNVKPQTDIDYFLPHLSSMYFKDRIHNAMVEEGIAVSPEKWFVNLPQVGNVGSASIYLALEELLYSGKLKKGEKIILSIPESSRFSYVTMMLTVV